MVVSEDLTCEGVQKILPHWEYVEKEITAHWAELKKYTHFSRKVELNMKIKKLETKCNEMAT